jgi:hypothetical protein
MLMFPARDPALLAGCTQMRSFVVQHGPDRRFVTIGRYPVVSLADARVEAKRVLAELTLGKQRPRSARWDEAADQYLDACNEKNRPSTVRGHRRLLNRHFPFKRRHLGDIAPEDIERKLKHQGVGRAQSRASCDQDLSWMVPKTTPTLHRSQSLRGHGADKAQIQKARLE